MPVAKTSFPYSLTRRDLLAGAMAAIAMPGHARPMPKNMLEIVEAPSNLGLRPPRPGHQPGTWRAPEALRKAGLLGLLGASRVQALPRPAYLFDTDPASRIRNGPGIRQFSEQLAAVVAKSLSGAHYPLVLGGDCSILLGCLLGARQAGRCGLIHVDGHSDFFNPAPGDPRAPFSAAGMDLALATGRGEPLLAHWGVPAGPLVEDADVVQIGERENLDPDFAYPEVAQTAMRRFDIRETLSLGIDKVAVSVAEWARDRNLQRIWLHVDVDVLDKKLFPAVDSPGSPGLDFAQLAALIEKLHATVPLVGADISVFDPELDSSGDLARKLAASLARGFAKAGRT